VISPEAFTRLTLGMVPGNDPAMTKSELIAGLAADNPPLRVEDAEAIVNAILNGIANALARGGRVELREFGTFTVRRRKARAGRNPRNGHPVPIEEKLMPFFKAGKGLRERVDRDDTHYANSDAVRGVAAQAPSC
jgi:integration host factor subunit beta